MKTVEDCRRRDYSSVLVMSSPYKMIAADGLEYEASLEDLRSWAREGRLGPASLVWCREDGRWLEASARHELVWDLPRPVSRDETRAATREPGAPALAGFVPRLLAGVADWMVILFLVNLALSPWRGPLQELMQRVQAELDSAGTREPDLRPILAFQLLFLGVYVVVSLLYRVGFNGRFGATPGKRLLGLHIVTSEGEPLGYGGAFLRYCGEWLCVLTLGLGYLMILSPQRRALHDHLSGTQVILVPRG